MASAVLLVAVLVANLQSAKVALTLLISSSAMVVFALLLADVIRNLRPPIRRCSPEVRLPRKSSETDCLPILDIEGVTFQ